MEYNYIQNDSLDYSKRKYAAKLVFLTDADADFVRIFTNMSRYRNNNHLHCIVIAVLEVFHCMILKDHHSITKISL